MTTIRDAAGKNHRIEVRIERRFWNDDFGTCDVTVLYLDGEEKFISLGKGISAMYRSAEYYLGGHHHPTHYYDKFAHLAPIALQMRGGVA